MRNPKVLSIADIKGGKPYICIAVSMDGQMYLDVKTFCGVPRKWDTDHWEISTHQDFMARSTRDLGLEPKNYHNQHRVFEFNTDNLALLREMVAEQDILNYLILIGVSNPDKTIQKYQAAALDDFDPIDFDDDFEDDLFDFSIVEEYGLR